MMKIHHGDENGWIEQKLTNTIETTQCDKNYTDENSIRRN